MSAFLDPLLAWLDLRMSYYELIYLDPLVCDPSLMKSRVASITATRNRANAAFLSELGRALKNPWKAEAATHFLDINGAGTRVKSSRQLQRDVAAVVNKHVSIASIKVIGNTVELQSQKGDLNRIADKPNDGSVIVVDTSMYTVENDLTKSISVEPRPQFNSVRQLAGALIEFPPKLMTLGDPMVGIVADRRVIAHWTSSFGQLRKAEWYPRMRTVGTYRTTPDGEAYIDVIALLIRPLLDPDKMLTAEHSSGPTPTFVSILTTIKDSLKEEIDRFDAAKSAGKPEQLTFNLYRDYLFPIHLLQLCCRLHHIGAMKLEKKSIETYKLVKAYLELIDKVQKHLDDQGKKLAQETDIEALLPDD